jgi:hypothetical protein
MSLSNLALVNNFAYVLNFDFSLSKFNSFKNQQNVYYSIMTKPMIILRNSLFLQKKIVD